ncbi:ATP-binding protein, partial [Treponema sp. R6D11]
EPAAVNAATKIGMPVVVKPFNGNQGKGVHINLINKKDVANAFREASKHSSGVIVEQFIYGSDYRILVVNDEVKAVSKRLPAMVVGDGEHTIAELVDIVNQDPLRGDFHENVLTKIRIDKVEKSVLKKRGITEKYIPQKNETIILRENSNISTGGTAIDCTDIIHPDNAEIAIHAARAIGIDIAGIDMVAEDISKSIRDSSGAVIEVNSAPGIRMHLAPSTGKPRNVAKNIVDALFPTDDVLDFPVISVTGTNGKTTTVR